MSRSPRANDVLHLVHLYPDELGHSAIVPLRHARSTELHRPSRDPQKQVSFRLKRLDAEVAHVRVGHGVVGKVYADVPGWIDENHGEVAKKAKVEAFEIGSNPLRVGDGAEALGNARGGEVGVHKRRRIGARRNLAVVDVELPVHVSARAAELARVEEVTVHVAVRPGVAYRAEVQLRARRGRPSSGAASALRQVLAEAREGRRGRQTDARRIGVALVGRLDERFAHRRVLEGDILISAAPRRHQARVGCDHRDERHIESN